MTIMSLSLPSPPPRLPFPSNSPLPKTTVSFIASHSLNPNISPHPIPIRHVTATPISGQTPSVLAACDSTAAAAQTNDVNPNAFDSDLDRFLSFLESLCILSSAAISVAFVINYEILSKRVVAAWGFVGLVGGVGIGAWIRRRQWRRGVWRESVEEDNLNMVERVERLEEDLKSLGTIVRDLSRKLEKLGIRFRVTRKALKQPLAETTDLSQKNSEATRALAAREDVLEKELGEIQKVLLAMQEQQQKQLELILAIAKSRKLLENHSKQASNEQKDTTEEHLRSLSDEVKQTEALQARNDRV